VVLTTRAHGGRTVAFEQWGDLAGRPVIYLHGVPNSRLDRWPDNPTLEALGIRLVTFDRPGYGHSDPLPGRTLLDPAADINRIADHLGFERFALSGMSGGGPFVLAALWALSDRVTRAAVSCGLAPLNRPGAFQGMADGNVKQFTVALHNPSQLEKLLDSVDLASALPDEETKVLQTVPGLAEMLVDGYREGTRQGWQGAVADYRSIASPWGFALTDITVPLSLWHGDRDHLVPAHHAEYVASQVRSAELQIIKGDGHLAMFRHQRQILTQLVRD
jgi:pimeloyl-ACP methyl ester carboxylesterase